MLETFYEMILKSVYICLHGVLSWPLWYNIHTPETDSYMSVISQFEKYISSLSLVPDPDRAQL